MWWENVEAEERCDGVYCEGFCGVFGCRGGGYVCRWGAMCVGGIMGVAVGVWV